MRKLISDGLFLGVDGCKNGWIAVVLDHGVLRVERHDSIAALINRYPIFDSFLIDMVIGLRNRPEQQRPDSLARKELRSRASTVFPVPSRTAVYADGEAAQKQANLAALGKSLAKQTVAIIPKIREVDEYLDSHPEYKNRILESHPELDFARLNGSVLLSRKKKTEGIEERNAILRKYLSGEALPDVGEKAKELGCKADDILDAVCLAVTAALEAHGLCETLPDDPEQDEKGLAMKLTVPNRFVTELVNS